jgi:hypothetical protein
MIPGLKTHETHASVAEALPIDALVIFPRITP